MISFEGRVVSTNVSDQTGTIKHAVPQIQIDENGVVGDAHAGPGRRQVSLLAQESIERFAAQTGRTFSPGEFAENITTAGVDLRNAAVLDRLTIGQVQLQVTQIGKACHGGQCAIYRQVGQCIMPTEGVFCRVLTGGTVQPGDAVVHQPRELQILVITLSDRASRGEYEDRSGAEIETSLDSFFAEKRWRTQIRRLIIPDDAERLRNELRSACRAGTDLVFTTGGTGVGPRDVTTEVVIRLADKTIPGIMEHIRLKFGRNNPNALLSRSVAAVLGRSLIYALPGSVKAVREYMGEILKTVEHLILTLQGVETH